MSDTIDSLGLRTIALSEKGPSERNEDWLQVCNDQGLLMIADGMGGGDQGDRASRTACETAVDVWAESCGDFSGSSLVEFVMRRVNATIWVLGESERLNLGTTLTLAAVYEDHILVGHVGDTRLYRIRDGAATLLTDDQRGSGSALLANIGGRETVDPWVRRFDRREGDVLVLATDGLWQLFSEEQLGGFAAATPPDGLAQELMRGRDLVASDNYSVLVAWDRAATRSWWEGQADRDREAFVENPGEEGLASLRKAIAEAGARLDLEGLLLEAWAPARDAAVLDIAQGQLAAGEAFALMEKLAGKGSRGAVRVLADRAMTAPGDQEAANEWMARAYETDPTPERALHLLKNTDKQNRERRIELSRYLLDQDPGPWMEAWTILLEDAMNTKDGSKQLKEVLDGMQHPDRVPGAGLLDNGAQLHPLDGLIFRRLLSMVQPMRIVQKEQDRKHSELKRQLGEHVKRLKRTEEGSSGHTRELQRANAKLDELEARLGDFATNQKAASDRNNHHGTQLAELDSQMVNLSRSQHRDHLTVGQLAAKIANIERFIHSIRAAQTQPPQESKTPRPPKEPGDADHAEARPPTQSGAQPKKKGLLKRIISGPDEND